MEVGMFLSAINCFCVFCVKYFFSITNNEKLVIEEKRIYYTNWEATVLYKI